MARKKKMSDDEVKDLFVNNFASEVKVVPIQDFLNTDNLEYMLYTIEERAIPSIVDGVKPGQRKLLYSMFNDKIFPDSKPRKSARVVGTAIGQYHPHGNASMYEALVGLTVPYRRVPLISGDGSFGKAPGDDFSQDRYTEVKLSKLGFAMVSELKDDSVEFVPTYDDENVMPLYLSPQFPVLLMNGSSGMAEAYSTNFPAHNPREIMDLCIALLKDPKLSDDEIFSIVPGPDWATGASVLGTDAIREYQATGKGNMNVRGTYEINKKKKVISLVELPPGVSSATLLYEIRNAARNGTIEGIKDVIKMSDKDHDFKIDIYAKRGVDLDELIQDILVKTKFETNFAAQCVALDKNRVPQVWNLRDATLEFLQFRDRALVARSESRLKKLKDKHTQATAFNKVLLDKEKAVDIIMNSGSEEAGIRELKKHFDLTDEQATYISNLRIKKLNKGSVLEVSKEVKRLEKDIVDLESLISSKRKRKNLIHKELVAMKEEFSDSHFDRKTVIDVNGVPTKRKRSAKSASQLFHYWKLDKENGLLSDVGEDISPGDIGWAVFSDGRVKTFDGKGLPQRITPKTIAPDISSLVTCDVYSPNNSKDLLIVSTDGKALRMKLDGFQPQGILGNGVSGMKLEDGAHVAGAALVDDNSVVLTQSIDGWKVTRVDDIPVKGRNTKGVVMHKVPPNDAGVFHVTVSDKDNGFIINGKKAKVSSRVTGINRGTVEDSSFAKKN